MNIKFSFHGLKMAIIQMDNMGQTVGIYTRLNTSDVFSLKNIHRLNITGTVFVFDLT
jgi:hypothetical protein